MSIAEVSKSWEGRTVDGDFVLRRFLGGSEQSTVFQTTCEGHRAAIKLVKTDPARTEPRLSHPNLIAILRTGRCEIDGLALRYIVMEYADENLAQVLLDRPLTAAETRDMLTPALAALGYIHAQGLVHGHLKPSNIMAVDDQLKLSSDGLRRAGEGFSRADDVRALGMTLVEVLTQRAPTQFPPKGLPEPFGEIAGHCLREDPKDRWTIEQIANRLREDAALEPLKRKSFAPVGVLVLIALVAVLVLGVVIRRSQAGATPVKAAAQVPVATPTPTPEPTPLPEPPKRAARSSRVIHSDEGSAEQPMPEIPAYARSTIRGRVVVNVLASVDASGAVTDATLNPPGGSRYFAQRALAAVRQWKFQPSGAPQQWRIRFEFQTTGTKVARQRLSP